MRDFSKPHTMSRDWSGPRPDWYNGPLNALSRAEIEAALDSGRLWVRATRNTNAIRCRRAGKTRTWKTRPAEFLIPIKFGFRGTGRVDHGNVGLFEVR